MAPKRKHVKGFTGQEDGENEPKVKFPLRHKKQEKKLIKSLDRVNLEVSKEKDNEKEEDQLKEEEGEQLTEEEEEQLTEEEEEQLTVEEEEQLTEENEDQLTEKLLTEEEKEQLQAEEEEHETTKNNPYNLHFGFELSEDIPQNYHTLYSDESTKEWPEMGKLCITSQDSKNIPSAVPLENQTSLKSFTLKENLRRVCAVSKNFGKQGNLTPLQLEFFSIIATYRDIMFNKCTEINSGDIRKIYCLHVMNHVLQLRAKVVHHNSKLSKNSEEEYRDQGFTRPTCLILVPFRQSCYNIVKTMIAFLDSPDVLNKKRFENEFRSDEKPRVRKKPKPEDYDLIFSGNIDEDFKIGIKIKNKSICLYSEFYSSDVIIASPLGLRQIIGADGDKDRDFDFLSSIEIFVVDAADVLMMQNWYHLVHIFKHINLLPKESHGCNFFRVRTYALDGLAKFYRQTMLLSSIEHAWFKALFNHGQCFNHAGYVRTWTEVKTPSICQVVLSLPQVFRKFITDHPSKELDDRFNFFISQVLPHFKEQEMSQTLIYIPSYFDFVRLRNYFRGQELSSVMICEYTKPGKVAQGRDLFFKGHRHFMLYTERTHFYHRYQIKGVRHVIFYELPTYPHYYQEICNFMLYGNSRHQGLSGENSCMVLASQFDCIKLKHTVGMDRAKHMLGSEKKVFMIKTNSE